MAWLLLAIAFTGAFAASAYSGIRMFVAKSRLDLAFGGLDAAVALAVLHAFGPWNHVSPLWWLVPVMIAALGVVAAVTTWSNLPLRRPKRPVWLTIGFAVLHLILVCPILYIVLS